MPKINQLILIAIIVLIAACAPQSSTTKTCELFNSCAELTLYTTSSTRAREVSQAITKELKHIQRMTKPRQNNALLRVSARFRNQKEFSVNPSIRVLLQKSKKYYALSDGLYNPANGGLLLLWEDARSKNPNATPDKKAINELIKNPPTMDHIRLFGIRGTGQHPKINFHFGLMASAYAIDAEIEFLKTMGIKNAKLQLNGIVRVIGQDGDKPWTLDIGPLSKQGQKQQLQLNSGEALCRLDKSALIIDPRNGLPAQKTAEVIVVAANAMDASMACHTLYIAGPRQWQKFVSRLPIHAAIIVGNDGKTETSLHSRLQLAP
jgi:thiamine biosynthesis lipoprotein